MKLRHVSLICLALLPWAPLALAESSSANPPLDPLSTASALISRGEWAGARQLLNQSQNQWSAQPQGWILLAQCELQVSHRRTALKRLNKALKLDPNNAEAYFWRGRTYEARGEWVEALNEYQAAAHCRPPHPEGEREALRLQQKLNQPL